MMGHCTPVGDDSEKNVEYIMTRIERALALLKKSGIPIPEFPLDKE